MLMRKSGSNKKRMSSIKESNLWHLAAHLLASIIKAILTWKSSLRLERKKFCHGKCSVVVLIAAPSILHSRRKMPKNTKWKKILSLISGHTWSKIPTLSSQPITSRSASISSERCTSATWLFCIQPTARSKVSLPDRTCSSGSIFENYYIYD